ncbi:hypothetical protein Tco_0953594 [Tanacetum coccineum]|uniref:Uncharacterized protein n=1 Tax=Tanacetum coccineum TaxID=301880 RepID=A0ABQ5E437_9ASTR
MMNYLKNQGTCKLYQLKNLRFEEVKEEFDKSVKQKRLKSDEAKDDEPTKKTGKRRKQMARKGLHTDLDKDDSEDSDEATMKSPSIVTYKIIKQGERGVYQIVREEMETEYSVLNLGAYVEEDELEKVLGILKNMFEEPLSTDPIWSLLGQQRIISWRYYDTCKVHCLNLESMDIYMLIERQYPLSAEVCKALLDKKLQGGKLDEKCYKMLKMMEKQAGIMK